MGGTARWRVVGRRYAVTAAVVAALLSGCAAQDVAVVAERRGVEVAVSGTGTDVAPARAVAEPATLAVLGAEADDLAEFCTVAWTTQGPTPREFIGSVEHVDQLDSLATVAPPGLVDPITRLRDHYDQDVDPEVPASQVFDTFPREVQEVALEVQEAIETLC